MSASPGDELDATADGPAEATTFHLDAAAYASVQATMRWKQLVHSRTTAPQEWYEASPPLSAKLLFPRVTDLSDFAVAAALLPTFKTSVAWVPDPLELVVEVRRTGTRRYKASVHGQSEFHSMNGNVDTLFAADGEFEVIDGEIRRLTMSGFLEFEASSRNETSGWNRPKAFRRWAIAVQM